MGDYFTILAERAKGAADFLQPILPALFAADQLEGGAQPHPLPEAADDEFQTEPRGEMAEERPVDVSERPPIEPTIVHAAPPEAKPARELSHVRPLSTEKKLSEVKLQRYEAPAPEVAGQHSSRYPLPGEAVARAAVRPSQAPAPLPAQVRANEEKKASPVPRKPDQAEIENGPRVLRSRVAHKAAPAKAQEQRLIRINEPTAGPLPKRAARRQLGPLSPRLIESGSTRRAVQITIGRIEVNAVVTESPARRPIERTQEPALSLEEYLKQRNSAA